MALLGRHCKRGRLGRAPLGLLCCCPHSHRRRCAAGRDRLSGPATASGSNSSVTVLAGSHPLRRTCSRPRHRGTSPTPPRRCRSRARGRGTPRCGPRAAYWATPSSIASCRSAYRRTNFAPTPSRMPSRSWNTSTWPSVAGPAPMPMIGTVIRLISSAVSADGTASKTMQMQPASCRPTAPRAIRIAESAVRPCARYPPSEVADCGVSPT